MMKQTIIKPPEIFKLFTQCFHLLTWKFVSKLNMEKEITTGFQMCFSGYTWHVQSQNVLNILLKIGTILPKQKQLTWINQILKVYFDNRMHFILRMSKYTFYTIRGFSWYELLLIIDSYFWIGNHKFKN